MQPKPHDCGGTDNEENNDSNDNADVHLGGALLHLNHRRIAILVEAHVARGLRDDREKIGVSGVATPTGGHAVPAEKAGAVIVH
jgi:hypothetical protein